MAEESTVHDNVHHLTVLESEYIEYEENEWLMTSPKMKPKLFSYDWAHGTLGSCYSAAP